MKEVPLFRFGDKEYNLNFNDEITSVYCVKDKISGVMVSQLIMASNDYVAIQGFKNFVDARIKENDGNVYQLIKVGEFSLQECCLFDSTKFCLINSNDELDKFLEDARSYLISYEED